MGWVSSHGERAPWGAQRAAARNKSSSGWPPDGRNPTPTARIARSGPLPSTPHSSPRRCPGAAISKNTAFLSYLFHEGGQQRPAYELEFLRSRRKSPPHPEIHALRPTLELHPVRSRVPLVLLEGTGGRNRMLFHRIPHGISKTEALQPTSRRGIVKLYPGARRAAPLAPVDGVRTSSPRSLPPAKWVSRRRPARTSLGELAPPGSQPLS